MGTAVAGNMFAAFAGRMVRSVLNAALKDVDPLLGGFDISLEGFDKANLILKRIKHQAFNDRKIHDEVGKEITRRVKENIKEGHSMTGVPFAELSPITLRNRKRTKGGRSRGTKPLIYTGRLLRSIGAEHKRTFTGVEVTRVSPEKALSQRRRSVKARVGQGYVDQHPITVGYGARVPARPYIGMSPDLERKIEKMFFDNLKRIVRRNTSI